MALRHFPRPAPTVRDAAQAVLPAYDDLLAPVTRRAFAAWLGTVNGGCRNPLGEEDLRAALDAIHADAAHLPTGAFTAETRRALFGETRFFPSTGDVLAVAEPLAHRLRRRHDVLLRLALGKPAR